MDNGSKFDLNINAAPADKAKRAEIVEFTNSHVQLFNKIKISVDACRATIVGTVHGGTIENPHNRIGNAFPLVAKFLKKYSDAIDAFAALPDDSPDKMTQAKALNDMAKDFANEIQVLLSIQTSREKHSTRLYKGVWHALTDARVEKDAFAGVARVLNPTYWQQKLSQLAHTTRLSEFPTIEAKKPLPAPPGLFARGINFVKSIFTSHPKSEKTAAAISIHDNAELIVTIPVDTHQTLSAEITAFGQKTKIRISGFESAEKKDERNWKQSEALKQQLSGIRDDLFPEEAVQMKVSVAMQNVIKNLNALIVIRNILIEHGIKTKSIVRADNPLEQTLPKSDLSGILEKAIALCKHRISEYQKLIEAQALSTLSAEDAMTLNQGLKQAERLDEEEEWVVTDDSQEISDDDNVSLKEELDLPLDDQDLELDEVQEALIQFSSDELPETGKDRSEHLSSSKFKSAADFNDQKLLKSEAAFVIVPKETGHQLLHDIHAFTTTQGKKKNQNIKLSTSPPQEESERKKWFKETERKWKSSLIQRFDDFIAKRFPNRDRYVNIVNAIQELEGFLEEFNDMKAQMIMYAIETGDIKQADEESLQKMPNSSLVPVLNVAIQYCESTLQAYYEERKEALLFIDQEQDKMRVIEERDHLKSQLAANIQSLETFSPDEKFAKTHAFILVFTEKLLPKEAFMQRDNNNHYSYNSPSYANVRTHLDFYHTEIDNLGKIDHEKNPEKWQTQAHAVDTAFQELQKVVQSQALNESAALRQKNVTAYQVGVAINIQAILPTTPIPVPPRVKTNTEIAQEKKQIEQEKQREEDILTTTQLSKARSEFRTEAGLLKKGIEDILTKNPIRNQLLAQNARFNAIKTAFSIYQKAVEELPFFIEASSSENAWNEKAIAVINALADFQGAVSVAHQSSKKFFGKSLELEGLCHSIDNLIFEKPLPGIPSDQSVRSQIKNQF